MGVNGNPDNLLIHVAFPVTRIGYAERLINDGIVLYPCLRIHPDYFPRMA